MRSSIAEVRWLDAEKDFIASGRFQAHGTVSQAVGVAVGRIGQALLTFCGVNVLFEQTQGVAKRIMSFPEIELFEC